MLATDRPSALSRTGFGRTEVTGIGYQGHDLSSFLDQVGREEISLIVDVRLNPVSRKRGFSKRMLAAALADVGVGYLHVPALGNPKDNRAGFAGDEAELEGARRRFAALLTGEAAGKALAEVARASAGASAALLCFEADQRRCHRDVIASALNNRADAGKPKT